MTFVRLRCPWEVRMLASANIIARSRAARALPASPFAEEMQSAASTPLEKRRLVGAVDLNTSATVWNEIANALENSEKLFAEGTTVTLTNVAGP
ncbi:MAG: hypothetical protein ACERKT_07600, partial [Acidobacteriota bacterium]